MPPSELALFCSRSFVQGVGPLSAPNYNIATRQETFERVEGFILNFDTFLNSYWDFSTVLNVIEVVY